MNNKFRIKVEQITGVDERGYEKSECVLDARVEDLNMTDLVQTLYKIDRDTKVQYGFSGASILPAALP